MNRDADPRAPADGLWDLLFGAALAALSVVVYFGVLRSPFVYDDRLTVVENPSIRHPGNIVTVLAWDRFRPLVNLSFAIDHALWDLNPGGFHLTNVVLHAVNVVLLFLFVARMVGDCRARLDGPWQLEPPAVRLIAVAVSALFAVHPMMT